MNRLVSSFGQGALQGAAVTGVMVQSCRCYANRYLRKELIAINGIKNDTHINSLTKIRKFAALASRVKTMETVAYVGNLATNTIDLVAGRVFKADETWGETVARGAGILCGTVVAMSAYKRFAPIDITI